MKVIKNVNQVKKIIKKVQQERKKIGFVPTMGALHQGHISLIKKARKDTDFVVVSVFINPFQFGPNEDFLKYPRRWEKDKEILATEKVDLVFYPSNTEEMYPQGFQTFVEVSELSSQMCGKFRPQHFRGVCTVVCKLFNIIQPEISYFGQKDYQQVIIIKRMVKDLNLDTKIKICPTIREKDGLAISSRNSYLNPKERKEAVCLYNALKKGRDLIKNKENRVEIIKKKMEEIVNPYAKIDYLDIFHPQTLQPLAKLEKEVLLAGAIRIGNTRLIDNILLK